jgi:hypothetical protein
METYAELPYPFTDLPRPGEPVHAVDLLNVATPIMRGMHAILQSLAQACYKDVITMRECLYAIEILAGQAALVERLLQRFDDSLPKGVPVKREQV